MMSVRQGPISTLDMKSELIVVQGVISLRNTNHSGDIDLIALLNSNKPQTVACRRGRYRRFEGEYQKCFWAHQDFVLQECDGEEDMIREILENKETCQNIRIGNSDSTENLFIGNVDSPPVHFLTARERDDLVLTRRGLLVDNGGDSGMTFTFLTDEDNKVVAFCV